MKMWDKITSIFKRSNQPLKEIDRNTIKDLIQSINDNQLIDESNLVVSVRRDANDYVIVNMSDIIVPLVSEINQQNIAIERLEHEIKDLKNK